MSAPVHFFCTALSEAELKELLSKDIDVDYPYDIGGDINWVMQTFLVLRQFREGLTIGVGPEAGKLNVAHGQSWRRVPGREEVFRASITADYRRLLSAHIEIVQNPCAAEVRRRVFVPYWPQPRLIPRPVERPRVENVAFSGRPANGNLAMELYELDKALAGEGMRFVTLPTGQWHDMRAIDVLVGVRSFDRRPYLSKPPSKLINAWHADIPFIGGWDSAFSAIGTPGENYIRVETERELMEALRRLRDDANYYHRLVEAGRQARQSFTREQVAQAWLQALDGPISEAWERWRERSPLFQYRDEMLVGADYAIGRLGQLRRAARSWLQHFT